jgi:hypothetical protein
MANNQLHQLNHQIENLLYQHSKIYMTEKINSNIDISLKFNY